MTLPLTCPACLHPAESHPANESGGFTCTRSQGETPSCRDCAAIHANLLDDCARVFAEWMRPMAWPALTAPRMPFLPEPAATREPFSLRLLPGALDFVTFEAATRPGLSPEWQERLLAAMDRASDVVVNPEPVQPSRHIGGITADSCYYIDDECTLATPGGHGIPQSAYTPTAREAPWS